MSESGPGGAGSHSATPGSSKVGGVGLTLIVMSVIFLVMTVATIAAGPVGYRLGTLNLETATVWIARYALITAAGTAFAATVGAVACLIARKPRGVIVGILVLTAAGMIGFRAYTYGIDVESLPPISDVQTDWSDPVAFSEAVLQERQAEGAAPIIDDARVPEGRGKWSGMTAADAQAALYELEPLQVHVQPADAVKAVVQAANRLGWTVATPDPQSGRVEAVTESRWYGLRADIAVRVTPSDGGSRIDVRSTSREAGPDMGANASRIKSLVDEIAFALRGN